MDTLLNLELFIVNDAFSPNFMQVQQAVMSRAKLSMCIRTLIYSNYYVYSETLKDNIGNKQMATFSSYMLHVIRPNNSKCSSLLGDCCHGKKKKKNSHKVLIETHPSEITAEK